jgi:hypothetical protein
MFQSFFCRQSGARIERYESSDECLKVFSLFLVKIEGLIPLPERERLARVHLSKVILKDLKHTCTQ